MLPLYVTADVGRNATVKEVEEYGLRVSGSDRPPARNCGRLLEMLLIVISWRLSLVIVIEAAELVESTVTEPKLTDVELNSTDACSGAVRRSEKRAKQTSERHTRSVLLMRRLTALRFLRAGPDEGRCVGSAQSFDCCREGTGPGS